MSDRFEKLEPAIYNKGKQCFVLQGHTIEWKLKETNITVNN
jgi:hypothetical protein